MTGKRLDHYSATTINHRIAALTELFTFRELREPELRNPIPSGREARRVSVQTRGTIATTSPHAAVPAMNHSDRDRRDLGRD